MFFRFRLRTLVAATVLPLLAGCGTIEGLDRVVDSATGAAVDRMAPESMSGGAPPPEAMHGYTMGLFQAVFYQGGYDVVRESFEPGEYVQWEASGIERGNSFEKALLKRQDDGSEWWRVTTRSEDGTLTIEALFAPPDDEGDRRVRRMRVQYPGEEPQEVPVSEQDSDKWVLHARKTLTEESYQGLKVGVEAIRVPAGSFTTDHLRTGHPGRAGTVQWWISEEVPGGIVRYKWEHEDNHRTLSLEEFGSDAGGSRLGAF
ncbi:MAG: hypothetical protein ACQERR_05875 [Pseudomonadota bacterium]